MIAFWKYLSDLTSCLVEEESEVETDTPRKFSAAVTIGSLDPCLAREKKECPFLQAPL
jgi:hypothetical protein